MSKFYIVCGSHSFVISALSAENAAMRLIDEVMAAHIWIYDDPQLSEQDRRDHITLEALLHMSSTVKVSERGAGHSEMGQFEVPDLLEEWHQLMVGTSKLFVAAGLAPRRVLPTASRASNTPDLPR